MKSFTHSAIKAESQQHCSNNVFFQPKLIINQPGDRYEQEADALAEKVLTQPSQGFTTPDFFAPAISRVQRKCADCEEALQRKENSGTENSGNLENYIGSLSAGGQPLNGEQRNFFESRFGSDFGGVRIHADADAARSAQSVNALAYTTGDHIVFNEGQYAPGTSNGDKLLAHELTHTIQYNFHLNDAATEAPITNLTTVQHLDMSGQVSPADSNIHGPDAVVRFTATSFDATGPRTARVQNVQLVVEKLRDFTAVVSTESAADRRTRFANTYQITNAVPVRNDPLGDPLEAMSDSEFDQVLEGLNLVPAGILSRVTGIPVHKGLAARGGNGEVAEYTQNRASGSTTWTRKITVFGDFFRETPEQKAFTIIHELGHALDFRPNETATGRGGASLSAATGAGSFRRAVQDDGGLAKGVSTYGATATSHDEYYAEAFTMYLNQPQTLRALRPHVYDYFHTQFP